MSSWADIVTLVSVLAHSKLTKSWMDELEGLLHSSRVSGVDALTRTELPAVPGPVQPINISFVLLSAVRFISENACTGLPANRKLKRPDWFLLRAGELWFASEG